MTGSTGKVFLSEKNEDSIVMILQVVEKATTALATFLSLIVGEQQTSFHAHQVLVVLIDSPGHSGRRYVLLRVQ